MALFSKFTRAYRRTPEQGTDVQDIIDNLNNILNTRRGYGALIPDLGIRDLNEYSSRDQIATAIVEEVGQNIERFEPRVQLVGITRIEDDNPFRLSFRIDCTLKETAQSLRMVFDSVNSQFSLDQS